MEFEFRLAKEADIPAIVTLLVDDPLGASREVSIDLSCYYRAYNSLKDDPNNEVVVIEKDGEIIATLQLTIIPGLTRKGSTRAQIEGVRVAQSHRGSGIGTQLMKWAIERARERGCSLVQLTTDNSRKDAHRFYERLGFETSHVGMKYYISSL